MTRLRSRIEKSDKDNNEEQTDEENSDLYLNEIEESLTEDKKVIGTRQLHNIDVLKRKPLYPFKELKAVKLNDSSFGNRNVSTTSEPSSLNVSHPDKSSESNEKHESKSNFLRILGAIIFLLCSLIGLRQWLSPVEFDVDSIVNTLKRDFKGQHDMTFRILQSALSQMTEENPDAPGIIILIASSEAKVVRDSFSSQLAKSISQTSEYVSIESNHRKMAEDFKLEIDNNIKNDLKQNKLKAVLVKNLDQIPFEAAMIFHSYCDHENAPFKKAVYVITITSDEVIEPKFGPKEWDALAEKRLSSVWQNSSEDQVKSLISRLTVGVCAIRKGET